LADFLAGFRFAGRLVTRFYAGEASRLTGYQATGVSMSIDFPSHPLASSRVRGPVSYFVATGR
jgi:hypothetical protein